MSTRIVKGSRGTASAHPVLAGAFVSVVLLYILSLAVAATVSAQPSFPLLYAGSVKVIRGSTSVDAPAGTVISARVKGVEMGRITTTEAGKYGGPPFSYLLVQGNLVQGDTIEFFVNNVKAKQTDIYTPGAEPRTNFAITAEDANPSPTRAPTLTPTATPTFPPTAAPTPTPTLRPTSPPQLTPTSTPTPTATPTQAPSPTPPVAATSTVTPTRAPSPLPTTQPTPTGIPPSRPSSPPSAGVPMWVGIVGGIAGGALIITVIMLLMRRHKKS